METDIPFTQLTVGELIDSIRELSLDEIINAVKEFFEDFFGGWENLAPDEQFQQLKVGVYAIAFIFFGWRLVVAAIIGERMARSAAKMVPNMNTFPEFFEEWFRKDYFPDLAAAQREELYRKSQRATGLLGTLAAAAETMLNQTTEKVQADMLFQLIRGHTIVIRDFYVLRLVICNVGTSSDPFPEYFIGMVHKWYPVPNWSYHILCHAFPYGSTAGTRLTGRQVRSVGSSEDR